MWDSSRIDHKMGGRMLPGDAKCRVEAGKRWLGKGTSDCQVGFEPIVNWIVVFCWIKRELREACFPPKLSSKENTRRKIVNRQEERGEQQGRRSGRPSLR